MSEPLLETLQKESRDRHEVRRLKRILNPNRVDEWEDRVMASILMEDFRYGRRSRKKKSSQSERKEIQKSETIPLPIRVYQRRSFEIEPVGKPIKRHAAVYTNIPTPYGIATEMLQDQMKEELRRKTG